MATLLLTVDSGGSKTIWRIINLLGETVDIFRTEGMGAFPGTLPVVQIVRSAFSAIGDKTFSGIFVSLGGPNTTEVEIAMKSVWPDTSIVVSREANGTFILHAAPFLSCSSAVLSGTGSTAVGLKNGHRCYAGGWGPVYGDGGSGGGICKDALIMFLHSLDRQDYESDLTPVFANITNGLDPSDFNQRMEVKRRACNLSRRELASHLPLLYKLYLQGAPSAVNLFNNAVSEICHMAASVTDDSSDAGVLLCGGFFRDKPDIVSLCRERFEECSAAHMVFDTRFDPIVGVCTYALESIGIKVTTDIFETILNEKRHD